MKSTLKYFDEHRHATWLELFFDLVFVAAIGFITHSLAHTHGGHLTTKQVISFPLQFIPIWWVWASHTWYSNLYDTDSKGHRFATLAIMLLLVFIPPLLKGESDKHYALYVSAYCGIKLILSGLYYKSSSKHPESKHLAKTMSKSFLIGSIVCATSMLMPSPIKYYVFFAGLAFEILFPIFKLKNKSRQPIHLEHLVERTGLLVIILLGETVISMVSSLQDVSWTGERMLATYSGFFMMGAIWWIYFANFHNLERAKRAITGSSLLYSNLIVCMGFILIANLVRHAIKMDLDNPYYGILAVCAMILFYVGKQIPYYILFPVYRKNLIINSIVCVIITFGSAFLSNPVHTLVGMTIGMFFYTFSNAKWTMAKDASAYLK